MNKISVADSVGVVTAVFTAAAAVAAALSAYYSYAQTRLAQQNILKSEQIAVFDQFVQSADAFCRQYDYPPLDRIWDNERDDFKVGFDVSSLEGKPGIVADVPKFTTDTNVELDKMHKDLLFQAMRLDHIEDHTHDPSYVTKFLKDLQKDFPRLDPVSHGDMANQVRYMQRGLLRQSAICYKALENLMSSYDQVTK